jgi:large-conductance mechanosensitive channel
MKGAILTVAVAVVFATAAAVMVDSMETATAKPRRQSDVVVRKKLDNLYRKLGNVQARVEHLEYEVSRVFSCAQHLDDRLSGNTAELRGTCTG